MSLSNLFENAKTTTWLKDCFTDEQWECNGALAIIGAEIHFRRLDAGKSEAEFAKDLKVSKRKVFKWEEGEHNFTIRELAKIAAYFGCKVEDLITPTKLLENLDRIDSIL